MARGKRTDPTVAVLVMVMFDMGFEPGMIAELAGVPRGTVNDIIVGNGPWSETPPSELFETTKVRIRNAIEDAAAALAIRILARLEEKIEKASLMESLSIWDALTAKGRLLG